MTSHPVRPSRRERLLEAIALEEVRLDRLEGEQGHARNRLAALRSELTSLGRASEAREASELQATSGVPETPQEKVRLRKRKRRRHARVATGGDVRPAGDQAMERDTCSIAAGDACGVRRVSAAV
jgi:hypothetical protein